MLLVVLVFASVAQAFLLPSSLVAPKGLAIGQQQLQPSSSILDGCESID
jgi:hypothetical protein